jgi:hypothetical protein
MLKRYGKQIIREPIESVEDLSLPVNSYYVLRESSLDKVTIDPKKAILDDNVMDNAK